MMHGSHNQASVMLGRVESVEDPDGLARVEVRFPLHAADVENASLAWAPVATAFAGSDYGAFLLPGIGDVVVLSFVSGDMRQPIVMGSIWTGEERPIERVGGSNTDRWVITGRAGTRIAIVEEEGGQPMVEVKTPGGPKMTISDEGGGEITLKTGGSTLKMSPSSVSLKSASITLDGAEVTIKGGPLTVESPIADFSGVINGPVGILSSVIATTYTPGAGNVW